MRRGIRIRFGALGVALLGGVALFMLVMAAPHGALAQTPQRQAQPFQQAQQLQAPQLQSRAALSPTVPAQPTKLDLSQPTAGASSGAAPPASTSLGSNGLTIAVILSCVAGILGLVMGFVALLALLRGGYGPFLRTLLPGKRRDTRYAGGRAERNGHDPSRSPRRAASTRRR